MPLESTERELSFDSKKCRETFKNKKKFLKICKFVGHSYLKPVPLKFLSVEDFYLYGI